MNKSEKLTCSGSWWCSPMAVAVALWLRTGELRVASQQFFFFFSASLCYSFFFFIPSSSLILLLFFTVFFPLTVVLLSLAVLLVAIGRWFQAVVKNNQSLLLFFPFVQRH
jgi:hypothetical protein